PIGIKHPHAALALGPPEIDPLGFESPPGRLKPDPAFATDETLPVRFEPRLTGEAHELTRAMVPNLAAQSPAPFEPVQNVHSPAPPVPDASRPWRDRARCRNRPS